MSDWTTYDETRYSNHPYVQTHPDRLAVIATLHGLHPPSPSRARVLEIGCGAGGNLLALAYASPDVRAVGVDLALPRSRRPSVAAEEVGIENAEFHHADVMDITDGRLGEFDYVISHGVYAWIPPAARDALLAAIKAHLAPDGVAYVSYNALSRRLSAAAAARGGDLARARRAAGARAGGAGARAVPVPRDPPRRGSYGGMLEHGGAGAGPRPADPARARRAVEFWEPVWFHEFASAAAGHGLVYVAEASPIELWPPTYPDGVEAQLDAISGSDRIAREQYQDLLLFRRFRSTMLCHDSVEVAADLVPDTLRTLQFTARSPEDDTPMGLRRRAQQLLADERPAVLPFDELRERLGASDDELLEAIMEGMRGLTIGPRVEPAGARARAGRSPAGERARPLADRAAAGGLDAAARDGVDRGPTQPGAAAAARRHARPRRDPARLHRRRGAGADARAARAQPSSLGDLGLLHG